MTPTNKGEEMKACTVKDIAKNLRTMKKEKLRMGGRILVHYRGREYEVVGMGHYHVIPDMTLDIRLTKYE